ncbi:uncharacterized protein [Battus philenor]|uniref:uncharacterized protein n=1 Tax=Battus philenor TaxID=42288 RepID=UPI0035CEE05C
MAEKPTEPTEPAEAEVPETEPEAEAASTYPPYPPYSAETAPPSVAETIIAGRDLRTQFKFLPKKPVHPPPRPARPRGPKATDVKLSKRAFRAHARCLRRHGAVLTDRLENMAKPRRRSIIYTWRDYAKILPPETIGRIRAMLDADEPFKPEQAYEYFVNLRKTKKKKNKKNVNQLKKDMLAICDDKRFLWARNATIAFARGIQQRLSKPGRYALADGMLRLSNLILHDICGYMKMRAPSRNNTNPKAKFMMEMSDKIVVWIDEILTESDDRMLMMDFDEDEDILAADAAGDAGFADDFLKMMQQDQPPGSKQSKKLPPAYLKFTGDMLEVFNILTGAMHKRGDENLIKHGKFHQSYTEAADLLKETPTFDVEEINSGLAQKVNNALSDMVKPLTSKKLETAMKDMVDMCSNFLAENADINKDKGPAFKALLGALRKKPNELLYEKESVKEKNGEAATELSAARTLESDHDDPNLSNAIEQNLTKLAAGVTTPDLQADMKETVPLCSKYLSQNAIDKLERGPAFDLLIKSLKIKGSEPFTPQFPELANNFNAAYVLNTAPGLTSIKPNNETKPLFETHLHAVVDINTPKSMKDQMNDVVNRCANYLSGFQRDREKALKLLLETMKKKPTKELAKRNDYTMTYGIGAGETEKAPALVPYLPVKDIAQEIKEKLNEDVSPATPPDLQMPMKALVRDVADVLSQPVAMKSGAAGEKYTMDYLIAAEKAMGTKPLYEYKGFNENYIGGAESLQRSPVSDNEVENKELEKEILMELQDTIPSKQTPIIAEQIKDPVLEASHHLASIGTKKGVALEHLVSVMNQKGDASLVTLQGYGQSYADGAHRISHATNLRTEKVDNTAYGTVKGKLDALVAEKPPPDNAKDQMQEIVEVSSKYLSAPLDDEPSKRKFLADLLARKESAIIAEQGVYKMTYKEAGQEIMDAPTEPAKTVDEKTKNDLKGKIDELVPQPLQAILKDTVSDGASNLADIIKGRGEVIQKIHDGMEKEKSKSFLSVGQFSKTHHEAAEMLETAPNYSSQHFATVIAEKVTERVNSIPLEGVSPLGKEHLQDGTETVSKYIAGVATKECGLDAQALAGWNFDKGTGSTSLSLSRKGSREPSLPSTSTKAIDVDMDHEQALQILQQKLKARGGEIFYKQPHNELTHAQAADWISQAPHDDKAVKESSDTGRLHKKFERKLSALVASDTPNELQETMQDVIIETSRMLSETFLSKSYKILAREAVISEMQNRCNELLVDIPEGTETFFYAAQRLKKNKNLESNAPSEKIQHHLAKKLEEMIKLSRGTLRKLGPYIKDYINTTSQYLSEHVTKPDKEIDAYVALLTEMEYEGDTPLVEGKINKSHKDAAAYLRKLTTFDDEINRADQTLKTSIETKLKNLMAGIPPVGYDKPELDNVIRQNAGLLTSYIKLQEEKTEALKVLIEQMDNENDNVLLRHGTLRKTYHDGANLLRPKTADQLQVTNPDPVVSRKIQIKLKTLVNKSFATNKYKDLIDDVVEDVTNYLAIYFLQPEIIQVCKCMKNVFIQCELWCEGTLRKMSRPCCKCSRRLSVQSLADVCPGRTLQLSPSGSRVGAPGVQISLTPCPSRHGRAGESSKPCSASKPTPGCKSNTTAAFVLYASHGPFDSIPTKLSASDSSQDQITLSNRKFSFNAPFFDFSPSTNSDHSTKSSYAFNDKLVHTAYTDPMTSAQTFKQTPIIMVTNENIQTSNYIPMTEYDNTRTELISPRMNTQSRNVFSSRTPIVTTDQMSDWHSMIVSLAWNVQAWRVWINDNINKILAFQEDNELDETWPSFQRTTTTEILQWQQYNCFSRQLILRIATKYKNKKILSPTRSTVKTRTFVDAHNEMLELIETFNRWTQWLTITIKETDLLLQYRDSSSERWRVLKEKVREHIKDWSKYNDDLSNLWETKFKIQLSDWVPDWQQPGPVWVVSACGAVPSGAVAAGLCDGEVIWVARTTHRSKILPAALYPSKHCCVLYAGGRIYHYTKYQVMCNATVQWVACRAGNVPEGAVRVGGAYVGRVRYRTSHLLGPVLAPRYCCYVIMFRRPVAFDCYEMLVMDNEHT